LIAGDSTAFFPRPLDFVGNIFEPGRPGDAVVRPEDLVALRVQLANLKVAPGTPPMLERVAAGPAFLVLHFPPQAITEETFFEATPPGMKKPDPDPSLPLQKPELDAEGQGSDTVPPPFRESVRARIADESRLVFTVPDGAAIPYTLEGILNAVQTLEPKVAANAGPRTAGGQRPLFPGVLVDAAAASTLSPRRRAALTSFAVSSLRIAASSTGGATLMTRQHSAGAGLRAFADIQLDAIDPGIFQTQPSPRNPDALTTAIEIPWRLLLSPHGDTRWRHATAPVTSEETKHTELWHSRLVAPDKDGTAIEPPYPDPNRTVRAIWAKTGEASSDEAKAAAASANPDFTPVAPSQSPFRMPMDDFDRTQISHLSSNFAISRFNPAPVETKLMMMTALGGWLDSRGAWMPPGGFSVEEWVHRASMGRDHYVKVVYKGFLFPFGHQVSLVKVTERKFHNGARSDPTPQHPAGIQMIEQVAGNTAYLRQRMFIIIREPVRIYGDAEIKSTDSKINLPLQFPFSSVRILTEKTPNLDDPALSQIAVPANAAIPVAAQAAPGQKLFWPTVNGAPFKFQCVGTDLENKRVAFDLPMIFIDNTLAAPFDAVGTQRKPSFARAHHYAAVAADEFRTRGNRKTAAIKLQRVALAASSKPGDTSVQVDTMDFGGFAEAGNRDLEVNSSRLSHPVFYPMVDGLDARIDALAHLSPTPKTNRLEWHEFYLEHGFAQAGEVFVHVREKPGMATLDFSSQGDRSGGFVQPNLTPKAISRLAGPVTADPTEFINGGISQGGGFLAAPSLGGLPLPLLFGCIPLSAIIDAVTGLADKPDKAPKFASEASNQVQGFVNGLVRLLGFVTDIASQPAGIAKAAVEVFMGTLQDHITQAAGLAAAQAAQVEAAISAVKLELQKVADDVGALLNAALQSGGPAPSTATLPAAIAGARAAIAQLKTAANAQVAGVLLPAGYRQSLLGVARTADDFLADLEKLPLLVMQGKALFDALDGIVGQPDAIGALFEDAAELKARVEAVGTAITVLKGTLSGFGLMSGAPRRIIIDAMTAVEEVIGIATDLIKLIEQLTGDELTIRFDWNPEISSFPVADPIFRANDKKGFSVAVEAKVKKHGNTTPSINVVCGLKHFDLVLIAPASFLELNFEKIEFRVDSAAKMDVDVLFNGIKFVGPLSFVETLRDLIPLDGFSDPPYLDISPKGIDAGFSVALPAINIGILSLSNLSLGAGFTVPFIGQPLSVRFNFCTREQPFHLTVYMFGGGGFFGVTIDPSGVQILEASFEFGAAISIDLGVASGGVSVMAGLYFRMEKDAASLTGYFRLAGHVDVLGIITASLELYLELRFEFESGKCVGKASLTIEISVFIFSGSVTVTCERKFAGSNGDPNLRQMLGLNPGVPLAQELSEISGPGVDYAWRDHCEAFA
jgi:hypothetical protein